MATYCEDFEEIFNLTILRVDTRDDTLEIRKAFRNLGELGLEGRVLK